ncbi:MAG: plasma membrane calcium [Vezdaea aestivalis]|nr:MAG: plasma membrane calcium [Vezdaea aestivalis]
MSDHLSPSALTVPERTSNGSTSLISPQSPSASSFGGETLRGDPTRSRSNSSWTDDGTAYSPENRDEASSKIHTEFNKKAIESTEMSAEEALRPDPGSLDEFKAENNPFAYTPGLNNKMLNPKSLHAYKALGGVEGIAKALRTDVAAGLSDNETTFSDKVTFEEASTTNLHTSKKGNYHSVQLTDSRSTGSESNRFGDRRRVFGANVLPEKKTISFFKLLWMAYNDKILILLTIAAVISLALGLYETLGQPAQPTKPGQAPEGAKVDWVEGVAICVAIIIVVIVTAINDWQKERQFVKLNKKKADREVKAIRSGKSVQISVYDIMAGDVLHLEPGDLIPVDGIFIQGHNLKCDESSATGESDQMKKTPGKDVSHQIAKGVGSCTLDPFIISGAKVLEGVGTYLVTSVGVYSSFGKIMMRVRQETEATPLQVKLYRLASAIAKLGSSAALLLFSVLLIRFLAGLQGNTNPPAVKASQFLDILIVAVTIIVVAVPEGLPLAVTLALAFATTRMLKENNLVRVLRACETMGNATTICSDKTGTLTQNQMTVVAGTVGQDVEFGQSSSPIPEAVSRLSEETKDFLRQSIVINSTAFEGEVDGINTFIGSKTETALLTFAKDHLGMGPVAEERSNATIVQLIPFDSKRKCMGAIIKLPNGTHRLLVKGAAEILLARAAKVITHQTLLCSTAISSSQREALEDAITRYARLSLRTIAILFKDFESWPPAEASIDEDGVDFDSIFKDMVFAGVVGIQDPLRPGVPEAVKRCQNAGVVVRMVTGDNVTTAAAIATECGIKTPNGRIMEGPEFRKLSEEEMDQVLPHLQVLARSSPEDKRILVERLKHLGETVAVTGDGTNDAPALKLSDVGFSMGIAGTEVAKEASEIILMDDNFSSIVKAMMWGRAVNDAVAKFLQFQITVNITAVLLAFVSAVSSSEMKSVLTAVQLLWVNLIMDTFAALALATDPPTDQILDRKPTPKSAPLITVNMWKMILGQAVYQLVVTFILYYAGPTILNYDIHANPTLELELRTMVFNTFVWMQIFNEFNNRRLDNKLNIFEGITRNWFFIGINCIMVGGQIMIIFVGSTAFGITRINGVQWAICIGCAIFCLPWAIVLRYIPDRYAATLFTFVVKWFKIIFGPVGKVFSAVWAQITRPFRALFRVAHRKMGRRSQTSDGEMADEEKSRSESRNDLIETKPQPSTPPPITITKS